MTDPISDMLTRIRNASRALLPAVEMPHSKMKESIAHILKKEGYVAEVAVEGKLPKTHQAQAEVRGQEERHRRLAAHQHARVCAVMSARPRFRACAAAWAFRSSPPPKGVMTGNAGPQEKSRRRTALLRLVN